MARRSAGAGRFREFYQCDVDAVGSTSPVVEAELLRGGLRGAAGARFHRLVLRINHRAVLAGVLDAAGVPAEKHGDALVALDKLDKIGRDGVKAEYERGGCRQRSPRRSSASSARRRSPARSRQTTRSRSTSVAAFVAGHDAAVAGLANMRDVLALAARTPAGGQLRVDLSLARGLSYYTGCIMEMTVPDLAGSLGGGGRYDGLVGMFLGQTSRRQDSRSVSSASSW